MKSIFEEMGGTYIRVGDYWLPDLGVTEEEKRPVGKYGRMRMRYLEEHRPGLYTRMLLSGKLMAHLQETDDTCRSRVERMVRDMAQAEGVTEALKARDQMLWVQKMNSLHACAEEIVLHELVYA